MSDAVSRDAVLDILSDEGWLGDSFRRIAALPAVQPHDWNRFKGDLREAALRKALEGLMAHEPDYSDTLWQDAREVLKGESYE